MSYEGYEEYLCPKGHYYSEDVGSVNGPVGGICVRCGEVFTLRHSVDETNGYNEDHPSTCEAPKEETGFEDDWKVDHHGNRYAEKILLYKPLGEGVWIDIAEESARRDAEIKAIDENRRFDVMIDRRSAAFDVVAILNGEPRLTSEEYEARKKLLKAAETSAPEKPFVVYWRGGKREILWGSDSAAAFNKAGYGGAGAASAIDWYSDKIEDRYIYCPVEKKWQLRGDIRISLEEFNEYSDRYLEQLLERLHSLTVELPSKDVMTIQCYHYGLYHPEGWVRAIVVGTAEYCEGPYHDDGDEDHHYMSNGSVTLRPEDRANAVRAARQMVQGNGWRKERIEGALSIAELKAEQTTLT